MKIKIISISDSDKHFGTAIQEYIKRLGNSIECIDLKPSKWSTSAEIIKKETQLLLSEIKKTPDATVALLAKEGKVISTEQLSTLISSSSHKFFIFVIWGPFGIQRDLLQQAMNTEISFWHITLPHGLAKLVLLEQIYRVGMIQQGRKYHY